MKPDDATPVDLRRKIMIDARQRRVRPRRWSRKYSLGWDAGRARHVQQILPACRVHHGRDWPFAARSLDRSPDLTRASCISVVDDVLPVTAAHQTVAAQPSFKHSPTFWPTRCAQGITRVAYRLTRAGPRQLYCYLLIITSQLYNHAEIITGRLLLIVKSVILRNINAVSQLLHRFRHSSVTTVCVLEVSHCCFIWQKQVKYSKFSV